ncbi:transmembrane protein, putative, partial [Bodo saltans]
RDILNASSTVTVWGTAKNISITGPNATASLAFGAIVNNVAASTFKPTLLISNTLSLIESNGATTVSRTGVISNLTHFGGTVQMMWGSNVASMQFGESVVATIAGVAPSIIIIGTNVTVTLRPTATVNTLQTNNYMPTIFVENTIATFRSNGATVVRSTGTIVNLTHDGGSVTIDRGGVVRSLVGYGNFTVNGTIMHMEATGTSKLILLSSGNTTNLTTASLSLMTLYIWFGSNAQTSSLYATVRSIVSHSSSHGNSGTLVLAVDAGGELQLHGVFGGAVVLRNTGGVVEKVYGYGHFDIEVGVVTNVSLTSDAAATVSTILVRVVVSTILVRRGASVDNLLIDCQESNVTIHGFVGSITVLSTARVARIVLSGASSGVGEFNASSAASLLILSVAASNGASVGCLAVMGGPQLVVTLHYQGASVVAADSTACPVMLLIQDQQPLSVLIVMDSCNITTRSYIASSLNRLVGTNSTHITLRNTTVTVLSSEDAGSNSDDSAFMEFEDTASGGTGGGVFSLIVTGATWSGPTSRWIRLISSSQRIPQSRGRVLNVSVTAVRLLSTSLSAASMVVFDYVCTEGVCTVPRTSCILLEGLTQETVAPVALWLASEVIYIRFQAHSNISAVMTLAAEGIALRVSACTVPRWFFGRIVAVCFGRADDDDDGNSAVDTGMNITESSIVVESVSFPRDVDDSNSSSSPSHQFIAVSFAPNTYAKTTNITVRCLDVPSLNSDGLVRLSGAAVDCVVSVAVVAIRQSSAANASLVRFAGGESEEVMPSSGNVVNILHSNVRVPEIVSSLHGSDVFDSGGGIQVECSFVATTPMSAGHFHSVLSKSVVVLNCAQTKQTSLLSFAMNSQSLLSSMNERTEAWGYCCWESFSMSATTTILEGTPSATSTWSTSHSHSGSFGSSSVSVSYTSEHRSLTSSFTTGTSSLSLGVPTLSLQCFALNDTILLWFVPLLQISEDVVVLLFDESYAQASTAGRNSQTQVVNALSRPIPRNVIRGYPLLAFNISFESRLTTAAPFWVVSSVTLASESQTHQINPTVHTTDTAAWNTIVLHPPSSGWIGATVPLLSQQTLRIAITVMCDNSAVLLAQIFVPVPAVPRELAPQVDAAGEVSQIASVFAGGVGSGSALARMMAIRRMVLCDADAAVGGGVIDLELRICDAPAQASSLTVARNAIVSNIVLIAEVAALLLLLAALWACMMRTSVINGTRAVCLPSSLLPVLTTVVPSTAASSVFLLARIGISPCVAIDVVLALIGLAIAVLPCGGFLVLRLGKVLDGAWRCEPRIERRTGMQQYSSSEGESKVLTVKLSTLVRNACARTHEWKSADGTGLEAAWAVLLEYRDLRYGAFDSGALAFVSCLSIVSGLSGFGAQCRALGLVVVLLLLVQLVLLVSLRPLTTLVSTVHSAMTLALTFLTALFQLVFVWGYAADADGLCCLLTGCCGGERCKMALDLIALVFAAQRRLDLLCRSRSTHGATSASSPQHDADHHDDSAQPPSNRLPEEYLWDDDDRAVDVYGGELSVDDVLASMVSDNVLVALAPQEDSKYWDATGAAVGTQLVDGHSDIIHTTAASMDVEYRARKKNIV